MKKFPPKRILVPMDLAEPSLSALKAAEALAKTWRANLELVYIQELPQSLSGFGIENTADPLPGLVREMEQFKRWREETLRRAADGFPASRIQVRTLPGWPPSKLASLAQGSGADLIVMGTHGYAGMARAVFGSVAEAVVRRANIPVLTVHRRQAPFAVRRVLVPYNLTPYADKALAYALAFSRSLKARVSVLYVAPAGTWEMDERLLLRRRLETVLGKARAARLDLRVKPGDPRSAILEEAAQGRFGLIALSAHRRPFSGDYVLGSTVERVLRHSRIPVLAVPSVGAKTRGPSGVPRWLAGKIY